MDSTGSTLSGTGDCLSEEDLSPDALVRQNYELRHRLEEEAANYKRRLDTYRQAQQHQAALVSRLQAKVLQYKQKCSELENQMAESIVYDSNKVVSSAPPTTSVLDAAHQTLREIREEQIYDLDTALKKLSEERKRCEKLLQLNTTLKDQLEESHQTNEALTNDLQKLSNDWDILREELAIKEEEWREEEQAFNDYYTSEHNRLLILWRDVVSVKRLFADIKSSTERDLLKMKNNIISTFNDVSSACNNTGFAMRMSLEGDLQRLQMMFQEKDANIHKLQERNDTQNRTMTTLEERCTSLKSMVEQLNLALEKASTTENELKNEINSMQHNIMELTTTLQTSNEKNKQLQKQISNAENERRILSERIESMQQSLNDLKHTNQTLTDQITRLQNELANNEVQRCALESQLRIVAYPTQEENINKDEELLRQLQIAQRERSEMRGKMEALNDKMKLLEADKRNLERQLSLFKSTNRSKSYERYEKAHTELLGTSFDIDHYEQENRELRLKVRRLETQLAEKEAELIRLKSSYTHTHSVFDFNRDRTGEIERLRAAQLQAEKLLEAREQSHRQQVLRLENQIQLLREQLNQEIKRRQLYVLRSSRAGREMQQLRQALGDSLRTVAQDPSLDAVLLEHEARKLDSTLTSTTSLPPSLALPPPPSYDRSSTPAQLK